MMPGYANIPSLNLMDYKLWSVIPGVTKDPQCVGAEGSRGTLPLGKKIGALGAISTDHLIVIHEVKQVYVNRRNVT